MENTKKFSSTMSSATHVIYLVYNRLNLATQSFRFGYPNLNDLFFKFSIHDHLIWLHDRLYLPKSKQFFSRFGI